MKRFSFLLIGVAALALSGQAQAKSFLTGDSQERPFVYRCESSVTNIIDVGDESQHTTKAIYSLTPGGGEGGQFDKTPILSTKVDLPDGACLDAHFSAVMGGQDLYGTSQMAMFQVTLTNLTTGAGPIHMFGHYEKPYGISSPAVALGPEPDVDTIGANFFQHVGLGRHDVPAGTYRVDVWWAGSPFTGPVSGATGSAFVLKLYTGK